MRIAGGVVLLISGLCSLVGGGCSGLWGGAASHLSGAAAGIPTRLAGESGGEMDPEERKVLEQTLRTTIDEAGAAGSRILVSGVVIFLGGILSVVSAVLFFVNTAKILGFLAPAVGIVGEILFFALVTAGTLALVVGGVKILMFTFAGVAATRIGVRERDGDDADPAAL